MYTERNPYPVLNAVVVYEMPSLFLTWILPPQHPHKSLRQPVYSNHHHYNEATALTTAQLSINSDADECFDCSYGPYK